MADVERRLGPAPHRRRRGDDIEDRIAEIGRARGGAARGRSDHVEAHRRRSAADRIARIPSLHMLRIVANRRPVVGRCNAGDDSNPCDAHARRPPGNPREPCPRTSSRRKSEAWSARFPEPTSTELVKRYTASVAFDQRLWRADIAGSLAHAAMLADRASSRRPTWRRSGAAWRRSAKRSSAARSRGRSTSRTHLNIEARLVELAGDAGKRLHTGRSRNDQVATDCACGSRRDRGHRGAARRRAARARRARGAAHRDDPARLHAPAGGAAGVVRAPPARVRRDVRADGQRMGGCARAQPPARRGGSPERAPARPRGGRQGAAHGRRVPPTASTR